MISFNSDHANQMLMNPKISTAEMVILNELKQEFENKFGSKGYFLITSSGSSQKSDESVKLFALSIQNVLNSAKRFNDYFRSGPADHWGLVLPSYHIGGLAVYARAFLAQSNVFVKSWEDVKFETNLVKWILENKISFMSLVPTQIFDIVHLKVEAPKVVKKVFVGASVLNSSLREQACQLGWPLIETYGMTETASMIAIKETSFFKLLPGIEVQTNLFKLSVKCDSLFTARLQKKSNQVIFEIQDNQSWFKTEDRVEVLETNDGILLKILERDTEYVKIFGLGVSLKERKDQLVNLLLIKKLSPDRYELLAIEDDRAGYKLILVTDDCLNNAQNIELIDLYNKTSRAYERIQSCIIIEQLPRTELGKLKTEELKSIVKMKLSKSKEENV